MSQNANAAQDAATNRHLLLELHLARQEDKPQGILHELGERNGVVKHLLVGLFGWLVFACWATFDVSFS